MANWSNLKSSINSVIKTNGNQEITGQVLQNVLNTIVSTLGENASFVGVATPETNPGTPDGSVFYLAFKQGTYTNFSGIVLDDLDIKVLYNYTDGKWYTMSLGIQSVTHNLITLFDDTYTFEEAIEAIPSKITSPTLLCYKDKNNEYQLLQRVYNDASAADKKWRNIGSSAINVLNKKVAIPIDNLEFTRNDDTTLHLKISSNSFVYLKKNTMWAQELSFILLNKCDITTDIVNNAIALSDTPDSYTKCTYSSNIYIVTNPISNTYSDDVIALTISGTVFAIPVLISKLQVTEQVTALSQQVTEQVTALSQQVTELNSAVLDAKITVRNWDWSTLIEQASPASGECIIPIRIPSSGYVHVSFYPRNIALDANFKLYTKNEEGKYQEKSILYTLSKDEISASILNLVIPTKVELENEDLYFGCDNCKYYSSEKQYGDFVLLSNNRTYKGLLLNYDLAGELTKQVTALSQQTTEIENDIQEINTRIDELQPVGSDIEKNEYWVKSYGNTFNQSDYVVSNAEVSESSIVLNQAGGYAALNKKYWSDRRIHRFVVTPTSIGELKINMAQNTSNLLFSDMTAGGNWTSEFRLDMLNNKIYIGQQEFDSSISFTQGRKYIVELKYIRRIFYVTVTDFLTGEKTESVLDTSESNQNGAFKCYLTFENVLGNYTIEQIETYLVSGVLLIIFGDSVTESCGREGKGKNYSEIIAEKYGSVTIVAQGGAGQSSWGEIFENEIKYIKPKYCSWHMGLNGGFSKAQVEQVILDCEGADIIPIINHVISYIVTGREETHLSPGLNAIIDEIWAEKGYRGYYGDIATAKNNNINDRTNYSAANSKTVTGGFDIIKTSASYDAFYTYTILAGKTVIENGEQRVLDTPLEVIMNIHPKSEGHKLMAERYFMDVKL